MLTRLNDFRSLLLFTVAAGCGPDHATVQEDTVPEWALDAFFHGGPAGGTTWDIHKVAIIDDGTAILSALKCSGDSVFEGVWETEGANVVVRAVDPDQDIVFFDGRLSKLQLIQTDDCLTIEVEQFGISGKSSGSDTLQRGDACLDCSEEGRFQERWCPGEPPPSCEDSE